MACLPAVIKSVIGVCVLTGSFWGLHNIDIDVTSPTFMRLTRLMRLIGQGAGQTVNYQKYDISTCLACLHDGKDFCISDNKCIPRATMNCQGPDDHITGDKEFSLHGNPHGVQHSMTCPLQEVLDKNIDKKDCYFDPECHALVDWDKIGQIKGEFFKALKALKEKGENAEVKAAGEELFQNTHQRFLDAGMPDDRIDFILKKWVKFVWQEKEVDTKDCFFDKECHAKVDWEKVTKLKKGFFARLKMYKEKDDKEGVKEMVQKVHQMFLEAGMPDDRIDYILQKWVKFVWQQEKKVDTKDCYFDKECHAKVDWEKIGKIKGGFFAHLKYFKEKNDVEGLKTMIGNLHGEFLEAGMPDDRIDYILQKWAKSVFPEAFDGGKAEDKPKPQPDFCAMAKERCMKDGEKIFIRRCSMVWKKCGDELGVVGV